MPQILISRKELYFLQALTILLFSGRAYQAIFWDLPIRSLFWSESLMSGPVKLMLGMDWHEYATHPSNDLYMSAINKSFGIFWIICAIAAALINYKKKWMAIILYFGAFTLIFLSVLYSLDKFMLWGEFFEYSLQIMTPFWLAILAFRPNISPKILWSFRIALAITFFSHGLYAFGVYPQPGAWVQWSMNMFFLPESTSKYFLKMMGVLDFIVAIYLLLPLPKLLNIALWYCVIWGTMTALARLTSNFYWEFPIQSLHQWGHEVLYRLLHGGIPFLLILWGKRFSANHQKNKL
jgi:hypothetical protein